MNEMKTRNHSNGYSSVEINENEKGDSWKEIEKKYFENKNNVLDWEGFKKEYYKLEHLLKQSLDELHKFQIEFSKKITYIELFFQNIIKNLLK